MDSTTAQKPKNSFLKTLSLKRLTQSTFLALGLSFLCGCHSVERTRNTTQKWWIEETGAHENAYTRAENAKMKYSSSNPSDYIFADGTALAVPSGLSYDLYISPYAPRHYFRSKSGPDSEVICPWSKKIVILGKRGIVAEKEVMP